MHRRLALAVLIIVTPAAVAANEPYIPSSADLVLLDVAPAADPLSLRLGELQETLSDDPLDADTATELVRLYIGEARTTGDPRYLGYAAAVLRPWAEADHLAPDLRLLRATVRQHSHQFQAALDDLDALLATDPHHRQARLSRAFIHQALGEPKLGLADCEHLRGARPLLAFEACRARMMSLTGEAETALAHLDHALARRTRDDDGALRRWALEIRADTARRLGQLDIAERDWREILEISPDDGRAREALADILLLQDRPAAVMAVLDTATERNLVIRRLLARRALGHDIDDERERLDARFGMAIEGSGPEDLRNETLFALEFARDPVEALDHARRNWATHKEPDDARLLLRAALAAGDRAQVAAIVDWVRDRGLEDVEFERLLGDAA